MSAVLRRALPELRPGERMVWRGAPGWRGVAMRLFRVPWVAAYFVALTLFDMAIVRSHEGPGWPVLHAAAPTALSGAGCVVILLALSWAIGRTTNYVLTTERIVMQFGIAMPATLSIPLQRVAASSVRVRRDGSGDVAVRLKGDGRVALAKLWPHARPWRVRAPEPMLRDVPCVGELAPLLCRLLSARDPARLPAVQDRRRVGASMSA